MSVAAGGGAEPAEAMVEPKCEASAWGGSTSWDTTSAAAVKLATLRSAQFVRLRMLDLQSTDAHSTTGSSSNFNHFPPRIAWMALAVEGARRSIQRRDLSDKEAASHEFLLHKERIGA